MCEPPRVPDAPIVGGFRSHNVFHIVWRVAGHENNSFNRDLNVGAIIELAPDLSVVTSLLGVDDATVRSVLNSWGPGKFDAEVFLDGKAFRPDGKLRFFENTGTIRDTESQRGSAIRPGRIRDGTVCRGRK